MESYEVGDQPTVTGTFRERGTGELADPTAITVKVRKPDGTITPYDETSMDNISVGVWEFTLPDPLDQDGKWTVKFYGTEGVITAEEISFSVQCSVMDEAI